MTSKVFFLKFKFYFVIMNSYKSNKIFSVSYNDKINYLLR